MVQNLAPLPALLCWRPHLRACSCVHLLQSMHFTQSCCNQVVKGRKEPLQLCSHHRAESQKTIPLEDCRFSRQWTLTSWHCAHMMRALLFLAAFSNSTCISYFRQPNQAQMILGREPQPPPPPPPSSFSEVGMVAAM